MFKNHYARSVSEMFVTLLFITALSRPAKAAEVVVTATGVVQGAQDVIGIFHIGKECCGIPFTLVFRFDDARGDRQDFATGCPKGGSGFASKAGSKAATAVLTINGVSYEFGKKGDARSGASRYIASACSKSRLFFQVNEGNRYFNDVVNIQMVPKRGGTSLTQNPDWSAPLETTGMEEFNNQSGFVINGNNGRQTGGTFWVKSLTITKGK